MNLPEQSWSRAILPSSANIGQAIQNLDLTAMKIVLVTNELGKLEGTISDGDIRRGLLRGLDMRSPIETVIHRNAFVVPPGMGRDQVIQLMHANKIHQIPIVDENHHIMGLHLWDEIRIPTIRPNALIILAGGFGTRMRPHTENCPKPMLQIAGKPMLEHIIDRAKLEGFQNFILAIHYLGHLIEEYFLSGERLGVRIDYIKEKVPLGTAGALSLLRPLPNSPIIVTNGDVLTDIRYGEILDFHLRHKGSATMAVRVHEWQHPFGVVETRGVEIIGFKEKPIARTHINAGVYVLDPSALQYLEENAYCDMPSVFERLQSDSKRTVAYPMHEPWLDVGRPADLDEARREHQKA